MASIKKNTEDSLPDKIAKLVYQYCEEPEIEDRCHNPNCEAHAWVDCEGLIEKLVRLMYGKT